MKPEGSPSMAELPPPSRPSSSFPSRNSMADIAARSEGAGYPFEALGASRGACFSHRCSTDVVVQSDGTEGPTDSGLNTTRAQRAEKLIVSISIFIACHRRPKHNLPFLRPVRVIWEGIDGIRPFENLNPIHGAKSSRPRSRIPSTGMVYEAAIPPPNFVADCKSSRKTTRACALIPRERTQMTEGETFP